MMITVLIAGLDDTVAQLGKRCSLGLLKRAQVLVDLLLGHSGKASSARRGG